MIGPGEAWLVPAGDASALAASLDQALASPQSRARAASLRLARERAVAPWLERYEAIYESLIPGPTRNP